MPCPPSRATEDLGKLAEHFLAQAAKELNVTTKTLHSDSLSKLQQLPWRGNVRQLQNTCRWLTVMASGKEILPSDLPQDQIEETPSMHQAASWQEALSVWAQQALADGAQDLLHQALPEFERILLTEALKHTQGHKQEAAKLMGWGRNTLTRKLRELNKMKAALRL